MTHPMEAAADAVEKETATARPAAIARAAISAFLDAADSDHRLSQFFGAQHSVIAALKRIAEEAP